MEHLDSQAIAERYHLALDAKKGKGVMDDDGIAAITDSVADIPQLLTEVAGHRSGREFEQNALRNALPLMAGLTERAENAEGSVAELLVENAELRNQNQRFANRLGGYAMNVQADLDPLFKAVGRLRALADQYEADGLPILAFNIRNALEASDE